MPNALLPRLVCPVPSSSNAFIVQCPMPSCSPMPNAQCPVPNTLLPRLVCPMPSWANAQCPLASVTIEKGAKTCCRGCANPPPTPPTRRPSFHPPSLLHRHTHPSPPAAPRLPLCVAGERRRTCVLVRQRHRPHVWGVGLTPAADTTAVRRRPRAACLPPAWYEAADVAGKSAVPTARRPPAVRRAQQPRATPQPPPLPPLAPWPHPRPRRCCRG